MRFKTLALFLIVAALFVSLAFVSFGESDADDSNTNVVYGDEYRNVYGDTVWYTPTTTFIIGYEYHDVFVGYGKDPQQALPGMTVYSKSVNGTDMMFMSGTPTDWCGILIPYDAGGMAYLSVESIPYEEYEYGASAEINGTTVTFALGETYPEQIAIFNAGMYGARSLSSDSWFSYTETHNGITFTQNQAGGVPKVLMSGTPTSTSTFYMQFEKNDTNNTVVTYTFKTTGSSILVTSITVSGDTHLYEGQVKLTPTVSPSDASSKTVSCELTSGSAYAHLNGSSRTSGISVGLVRDVSTDTMGTCKVKFTSTDSGGVYKTITVYVEKQCTIQLSFNANGGSPEPQTQTSTEWTSNNSKPASKTFTIPATEPTRSGYTFNNWKYSTTTYKPGSTISIAYNTSSTVTRELTAQWTQLVASENVYVSKSSLSLTAGGSTSSITTYGWTGTQSYSSSNTSTDHTTRAAIVSGDSDCISLTCTNTSTSTISYTTLKITPLKGGSATIRVTSNNSSAYADIDVTVTENITIRYHKNDGDGDTYISSTVTKGKATTLYTTDYLNDRFSNTGYTLTGLNSDSSGNGVSYIPGTSVTFNEDTDLYCIWTAAEYTLTYNSNGGSNNPSPITQIIGNISLANPGTKSGYTFDGWCEGSVSGNNVGKAGTQYLLSKDVTLVAKWTANYTVTFNYQSGTGTPPSVTVTQNGSEITLPSATRTGYHFDGWYTAASGGGTKVGGANATYTPTKSITLYANWTSNYVVSFDYQGGSGTQTSITVSENGSSVTLPNATKSGYTFKGWYTSANGGGTKAGNANASYTPTKSITLFAYWEVSQYTITMKNPDGSTIDTVNVPNGNSLSQTPTKIGHKFLGWYSAATDGTRLDSTTNPGVYTPSGNTVSITIYAHWQAQTYKVYFTNTDTSLPTATVTFGEQYGRGTNWPADPESSGKIFGGWSLSDNESTIITSDTVVSIASSHTLKAVWTDKTLCTITFVNGTDSEPMTAYTGDTITLPTPGAKYGYTFKGWYTAAGDGSLVGEAGESYKVLTTKTFYAQWQGKTYTISFNSDGGSTVTSKTVTFGEKYGTLAEPTKSGYDFMGWYLDDTLIDEDSVVDTASNHTLKASWEVHVDRFTVTYYKSLQDRTVIGTERIAKNGIITKTSGIALDGYRFTKWVASNGTDFDYTTPITQDTNLFGVYEAVAKPTGSISIETIVVGGQNYTQITVDAENADSVQWDLGNGDDSFTQVGDKVVYRYDPGNYTIKITLTNEGGSTILEKSISVSANGTATTVTDSVPIGAILAIILVSVFILMAVAFKFVG